MTISWWSGEDDVDRAEEYRQHLQSISSTLPSAIRQLAHLPIHDAHLTDLQLAVPEAALSLRLDLAGEPLSHLSILYDGVSLFKSTGAPDEGLASPGGYGDLGYDEVDVGPNGLFIHRLLFSNGIEFEIVFTRVTTSQLAV